MTQKNGSQEQEQAKPVGAIKALVHYKGYRYFLCNVMADGKAGITRFATGQKGNGKEGTWRDAEDDGVLGMNPIAQGAVDSVAASGVPALADVGEDSGTTRSVGAGSVSSRRGR